MNDGSALILTVVLTSLLAIVGVLFVMMARVNQIATSGLSENKELDAAIETVIAKISEELALDIPRKDFNGVELSEYYDYSGPEDKWLASLEPYDTDPDPLVVNPYWRQISDLYNKFDSNVGLQAEIIPDYQDATTVSTGSDADADGDGVADSKWVELDDITSSRGKPIYAAIRVVDNSGMLNVNTAYKFDPNDPDVRRIDGSSQMQINLMALAQRSTSNTIGQLDNERYGFEPHNLNNYIRDVVWHYDRPDGNYTPFDISDELELRNRFILNEEDIDTRVETVWSSCFQGSYPEVPIGSVGSTYTLSDWFYKAQNDIQDPNAAEPEKDYSYRHISTTYNMDRIINPYGVKMTNISDANVNDLCDSIRRGFLDANYLDADDVAAQIAVNLKDYRDGDSEVTPFVPDVNGPTYYGFERPCVYISELVHRFVALDVNISPVPDSLINMSYGIELYKPYSEDDFDPNQWQLVIEDYGTYRPVNWSGTKSFHVMLFEHPDAPLDVNSNASLDRRTLVKSGVRVFKGGKIISLQRLTDAGWITVDSKPVPYSWEVGGGWLDPTSPDGIAHSVQRDITLHKCIRRLWDTVANKTPTLGSDNNYKNGDSVYIRAHPEDTAFTNVGEIGMVFRKSAYSEGPNAIGPADTEADVRLNLADFRFQQIFNYLTVIDPYNFHPGDVNYVNEKRIKGRININTAPWFVLAQLPWVSQRKSGYDNTALAEAIAAYRDKTDLSSIGGPNYKTRIGATGFENIGQLCNVTDGSNEHFGIDYYKRDGGDQMEFPDFDPNDGVVDDFEERDLIFARISDLVTVRSDVFTAYILVRIGSDGPQKRVIAILDRSDVYSPADRMKIVAVQPVADPR